MNEREKQRVCDLIRSQMNAKRAELCADPTADELARERAAVLKSLKLDADARALAAAKAKHDAIAEKLYVAACKALGETSPECKCSFDDWSDKIDKIVDRRIAERSNRKARVNEIESKARELIARVLASATDFDVRWALKEAGLL